MAFSVQRSAFSVQRSAFSVQRSAFSVGRGFSLGFRSRWTPAGISFLARRPPCDSVAAATGADTGARRSHSTNRTANRRRLARRTLDARLAPPRLYATAFGALACASPRRRVAA
ncbi:hypothetical protein ACX841_17545, partial [Burkholderia pseudomallei]